MQLITGLGNKGKKYEQTRHNAGFMLVDRLSKNSTRSWREEKKFESLVLEKTLAGKKILLTKPQTMMNSSGRAVRKVKDYYKLSSEQIWIVHDDKDLKLGEIRISVGSGSAGHKGVQSVIDHLGSKNFTRFRIGVMTNYPDRAPRSKKEVSEFLLSSFYSDERDELQDSLKNVCQALRIALKDGIQKAKTQELN